MVFDFDLIASNYKYNGRYGFSGRWSQNSLPVARHIKIRMCLLKKTPENLLTLNT